MFLVNSRLGLFTATLSRGHPLSRSYGVILPSSLTTFLSLALGFSPHLPVSVCGTDIEDIRRAFLVSESQVLPSNLGPLRPAQPTAGLPYLQASLGLSLLMATESLPYVHRLRLAASP